MTRGRDLVGSAARVPSLEVLNPVDHLQRSVLVAWRQDMIRNAQAVLVFDGSP